MNYMNIINCEATKYVGVGMSIFFSGCQFRCKRCHNYEAWDFSSGKPFTKEIENKFIEDAKRPFVKRIVILGGEPLHQNLKQMKDFVIRLEKEIGKKIVMFTGYTFEELDEERLDIVSHCDILIDGKWDETKYNPKARFFGSDGQRILLAKESVEKNEAILEDSFPWYV